MSAIDIALYGIIAVFVGVLVLLFLFYAFSGQDKPPSNLTEETLKRLIGSTGRATSDITESSGTVVVTSEEFSARTSEGLIQKGTLVKVRETYGLMLLVEKAQARSYPQPLVLPQLLHL
ncbi:MAG TPA: NfeD family protein [Candidatus Bathyarchaeia archaeon]|nr:NfeD family protein [Candidatus Bathyarchaeia archaeon]